MRAKRIVTKVGDIFEVPLDETKKRYFQFIAIDVTQLSSSTIRVFKTSYPLDATPQPNEIVRDEVDFYSHTSLRGGIVQGLWKKIGKSSDVGELEVLFRGNNDQYDPTKVSEHWFVWKISQAPKRVGKLEGENRNSELGAVCPPMAIIDRMKKGSYRFVEPRF